MSNKINSYNNWYGCFSNLPPKIIQKIIRECPKTSARVCKLFYQNAAADLLSQWKSLENNGALSSKFRKKLTEIRGGDDKKNGFDLIHEFFLSVKSTYKEAFMPPLFPFDEKLGIFVKITQVDFTRLGENMLGDFENYNLYKCWPKISLGLQKMGVKLPLMDGNEIRIWMRLEANQQIVAKIRTLDLSNLGLTSLPREFIHFTGLIGLSLKGNKLTHLPESICNLRSLKMLDLSDNELSDLPESICNLRSLKMLDLSDNELSDLPESIDKLKLIEDLNLSNNKLTGLPESICKLLLVRNFKLSNNKLTRLPESIWNLRSLELLDLSKNKLTYLPPLFDKLRLVEKINLCDNKLSALPLSICNFVFLRELDLSKNKLKCLPPLFGNLITSVQKINLCDNELSDIPESIYVVASLKLLDLSSKKIETMHLSRLFGDLAEELQKMGVNLTLMDRNASRNQIWHETNRQMLAKIRMLDLSNLGLTGLPPEIIHFTGLIELCLEGNNLTDLPESICHLASLESLHICENKLTHLPKSICNLASLKQLDLSKNKLKYLPPLFGNLASVEEINLYDNELLDIPESFCNLASLKQLDLSKNKLKHLPPLFGNLASVEEIKLYDNELLDIPESFCDLASLRLLDLSQNKLTHLPKSIGNLVLLKLLNLSNNRLTYLPSSIVDAGKRNSWEEKAATAHKVEVNRDFSASDAGSFIEGDSVKEKIIHQLYEPLQDTLKLSLDGNTLLLIPEIVLDQFASNTYIKNFKKLRHPKSDSSPLEQVCQMIRCGSEDSFNDPYGNFTEKLQCLIRKLGSSDQTYLYYLLDKKIHEKTGEKNEGDYISIARNRFKDMRLFASALGELLYSLKSIKNIN